MTDRREIADAMRAGSEAGAAGRPATECPYDPSSPSKLIRLCGDLWRRQHARHDPLPVTFDA